VVDQHIVDVTAILSEIELPDWPYMAGDPLFSDLNRLCGLAELEMEMAKQVPLSDVNLECLVTKPTKIIGAPVNYHAHIAEAEADQALSQGKGVARIRQIGLFLKASSSLVAPSQGMKIRFPERRTDHELELAVVIGKPGTNISKEDALQHVAGYTVGLDMTVRGSEDRSLRKSLDTYTIIGPWLVTADEIPDPQQLDMQLEVNGDIKQAGSTVNMILGVAELIEFASAYYTLYPGDILLTGTPEGVGPVQAGDEIYARISAIGEFRVQVS
jgi:2-keto-4-pentenoate hydratase/2-oxohepta-3-ene-1,7-dioic acid hydratase in catechol pathway